MQDGKTENTFAKEEDKIRMKKSKIKKSTVLSWSVSYVMIFIISFAVYLSVYYCNKKVFERELNSSGEMFLNQIVKNLKFDLNETGLIAHMIADLPQTENALNIKTTASPEDKAVLRELADKLYEISAAYEFVDEPCVYLSDIDTVVSSETICSFEEYYEQNKNLLDDNLSLLYLRAHFIDNGGVKMLQGTDNTVFYSTILGTPSSTNLYMPGCVIIKKSFYADSAAIQRGFAYTVLDRYKTPILFSSPFYKRKLFKKFDPENDKYISLDGEKYFIKQTTDNSTGCTYIAIIPYSRLNGEMNRMGKINLSVLCLCFLGGLILILLSVRHNFMPVKGAMSVLRKNKVMQSESENELEFISDTLSRILSENNQLTLKLNTQQDTLRIHALSEILRESTVASHTAKLSRIGFLHEWFAVSVIYVEDFGEFFSSYETDEQYETEIKLAKYAIRQIIQEMLENSGVQAFYTEMEQLIAFVICAPDSDADYKTVLKEAKDFLNDNLKILLTISVSEMKDSAASLPELYLKCLDLLNYRSVSGKYTVITEDYRTAVTNYSYIFSPEDEGMLKNYILQGEAAAAAALCMRILENNVGNNDNRDVLKYITFDLVSTVLKVCEIGENDKELRDMMHNFLNWNDFETACEKLKEIIIKACSAKKNDISNDIVGKAVNFVERNYRNVLLSVSMIADNLGVSAAYLSHVFHKTKDEKLLDFISRLRINHAKELLASGTLNVSEISTEVGYLNPKTFRRIFKKYTGMLPTEYRDTVAKEK